MKKFLIIFLLLLVGAKANAEAIIFETNVNMENYWKKTGIDTQKVQEVGYKIVNANKMDKYIVIRLVHNYNTINSFANPLEKSVNIYTGILPYLDSDDELAYVIAHEMGHNLDYYDSVFKYFAMLINSKSYEIKADLIGIDLMTKAGYNPAAAITAIYKISGEPFFSDWIFASHPKGTVRMMNMYKYIYKKYPWALESEMTTSVAYQNFVNAEHKEIDAFIQQEKYRKKNRSEDL